MKIKTGQFGSEVPDSDRRLNEGIGDRVFAQHIDWLSFRNRKVRKC